MTVQELRLSIQKLGHCGEPIKCSKEDYPQVRLALQNEAGRWIDTSQHIRAQLALCEVQRLDTIFAELAKEPT